MVDWNGFSDFLKIFLQIAQVVTILFAVYKFTRKPHDTLETRVSTLEIEHREIKQSLLQGNDKFREQDEKFRQQDKTNGVILHSVMALIQFEIQYCLTEHKEMSKGLEQAKEDLDNYLAKKK